MRLIDADALLDDLQKHASTYIEDFVRKIIDRQPTIQSECEDAVRREAVLDEIHRYMEESDYTIGLLHDNSTVVWQPLPKKMVTRQERYEIEVGICNSLNAQAGRFRYSDPWLSDLLLRAQETINKLLEEHEEGADVRGDANG